MIDWLQIHYNIAAEPIKYDIRSRMPVSPTHTPVTCLLYGSHIVGMAFVNRQLIQ